jgi:transposase
LSQIHGASGMALIKAILAGERNAETLFSLCHAKIRDTKGEQLYKALEGHYTKQGLFALRQALKAYEFYQEHIMDCDRQIDSTLQRINKDKTLPPGAVGAKRKAIRHNKPNINGLGDHLLKIFDGRDATKLPGFTDYNWLQLYAGSDLSKWPTEKHFTSWLGLSPGQHNTGKTKKSKSKGKPTVGQIFKQMAHGLLNSKYIGWGAFARRLRGRKGPAIAIKATARKLAAQYWRLIVKGTEFVERGMEAYQNILKEQKQRRLEKLALELNMGLVPA